MKPKNIVEWQMNEWEKRQERIMLEWITLFAGVVGTVVLWTLVLFLFVGAANAVEIDMRAIAQIESSGNPSAWNKRDDSRGLYQITPICLEEWNNYHPAETYTLDDLWDAYINERIAQWYLTVRIPAMLRYYDKPITTHNVITAYNAGISYVAHDKPLPRITQQYLTKYARLTK